MAGVNVVFVPYRGAAPAVTDLLGGQIQFMVDAIGTLRPHIEAGKIKALAVTSTARNPALPNVPTMIEAGVPGYTLDFWTGVATANGTSPAVIAKLNGAINNALKKPDVQAAMAKFVIRPNILNPAEAVKFMEGESAKWGQIVKQAGVKLAN
jgi:tripartite-type tricarboxylate transporter receptor subunit TctC